MGKRIDSLKPDTEVELLFVGEFQGKGERTPEPAVFLGIEGTGDDRRAKFLSDVGTAKPMEWEAYRYNGRWVYGSSAETLRLISVKE